LACHVCFRASGFSTSEAHKGILTLLLLLKIVFLAFFKDQQILMLLEESFGEGRSAELGGLGSLL